MMRKGAGGTPATTELSRAGVRFKTHAYTHDPGAGSFGLEAAQKLRLDPDRVYKTLFVSVDGELVVGIVPVSGQLDLKAVAAAVGGKKASLADPRDAERASGYVVGGISPIGQRSRRRTVLDESALHHPSVFVSAGRRGLDLELSPADLVHVTHAITAPIGRPGSAG